MTIARPTTEIPHWATDDIDSEGQPLRLSPPDEVQNTGLLREQPMGRQWFNYMFYNFCEWLRYLESNISSQSDGDLWDIKITSIARPDLVAKGWVNFMTEPATVGSGSGTMYWYEKRS